MLIGRLARRLWREAYADLIRGGNLGFEHDLVPAGPARSPGPRAGRSALG
jgi:hypothetical protein